MSVRPAKTQISLGIRPVWSESSLSAWRKLGSLATHWAQSDDWSDWADAQADLSLRWAHTNVVGLSWGGSNRIQHWCSLEAVKSPFKWETWFCQVSYLNVGIYCLQRIPVINSFFHIPVQKTIASLTACSVYRPWEEMAATKRQNKNFRKAR